MKTNGLLKYDNLINKIYLPHLLPIFIKYFGVADYNNLNIYHGSTLRTHSTKAHWIQEPE